MTISAPAKTNLSLRVLGKRDDGFHAIDTRMVRLSLADELTVEPTKTGKIEFTCSDSTLPTGEENLVLKAVRALENRAGRKFSARIHLEKQIPSGAGLGGGSSDAAAILKALNELENLKLSTDQLADVASEFGSDVPFFVYDSTCDCTGRGEIVTPVKNFTARLPIILAKPDFGVAAGWAYQEFADSVPLPGVPYLPQLCPWGAMVNELERPVFAKHLVLARLKIWLLAQPEVHAALMSGSGSTMLAVLNRNDVGLVLTKRLAAEFGESTWLWAGSTI